MMGVYAVYDVKAEVCGTPFFMANNGMALRAFGDLAEDSRTTVARHPSDFKLVFLAWFDETTGVFTPEAMVTLAWAADVILPKDVAPLREVAHG